MRKRESRDLDHVQCIKSKDQKVLVKDIDTKDIWAIFYLTIKWRFYMRFRNKSGHFVSRIFLLPWG